MAAEETGMAGEVGLVLISLEDERILTPWAMAAGVDYVDKKKIPHDADWRRCHLVVANSNCELVLLYMLAMPRFI